MIQTEKLYFGRFDSIHLKTGPSMRWEITWGVWLSIVFQITQLTTDNLNTVFSGMDHKNNLEPVQKIEATNKCQYWK